MNGHHVLRQFRLLREALVAHFTQIGTDVKMVELHMSRQLPLRLTNFLTNRTSDLELFVHKQNMSSQSEFVLKSLAAINTQTRLGLVSFQMANQVFEALTTGWTRLHILRKHVLMDLSHVKVIALPRIKSLPTNLAHVGLDMTIHELDVNWIILLGAVESPHMA